MAEATKTLMVAWRKECAGLSLLEMGALWTLTAHAECGWYGGTGVVVAQSDALKEILVGMDPDPVLEVLKKRGRLDFERVWHEGKTVAYKIRMGMWTDRWYRERMKKREGRKTC